MTLAAFSTDRYAVAAQEDRCAPRTKLQIPATLRPSGDKGFSTVVHDLSLGGFSCEAVTGMRPGALCWLTLPGLAALQAEVAWNNGAMVGCAFANLLNPAVHDAILARFS
jgi:PilZ domain